MFVFSPTSTHVDSITSQMAEIESKQKEILEKLQALLDQSIEGGVPGLSAAIRGAGTAQWDLTAGFTDINAKSPISQTSAFGIGSITKVFVAVVVLQLVQEKKLRLENQAVSIIGSDHLERIQHAKEATIGQLLSHASAISSWEDEPEWQQDGRGRRIKPTKLWKKEETLQYVRNLDDNGFEVGKFNYANTNYTILGLIIEYITQNTAEGEIRRRILQPLKMTDTYFDGFEQPNPDQTPHRYHWATDTFRGMPGISSSFKELRDDLVDVTGTNLSVSWTAGGMISTPTDLLKFATAFRNGALLNPASMETIMQWRPAFERMDMGNGIFRLKDPKIPGNWIGHNGGVLGFTAGLWWENASPCTVAVLSNVGVSHAGTVPSSAAHVVMYTDFMNLAAQLAAARE